MFKELDSATQRDQEEHTGQRPGCEESCVRCFGVRWSLSCGQWRALKEAGLKYHEVPCLELSVGEDGPEADADSISALRDGSTLGAEG